MSTLQTFVNQQIRNYLIGSLITVVGVGGMFIFSTLTPTNTETLYLVIILIISLLFMCSVDIHVFHKHLHPIRSVFTKNNPTLEEIRSAYLQAHHFPILTIQRILVPHLLGITIPAVLLTITFIQLDLLHLPYRYIFLASMGALLIAGMHGFIEFFLCLKAVQPLVNKIRTLVVQQHNAVISLEGEVLISIRQKFQLSTLFIGIFPLLLFSLASQVRLNQLSHVMLTEYWNWAIIVLLLSILFASFGAYLLFRDVSQPLEQIQAGMKQVQEGNLHYTDDIYSDEFSKLIAGFNSMIQGIKKRDKMNSQLLDSFYTTLSATLDARDHYTAGHSTRVAMYSIKIGEKVGLNEEQLEMIKKSALLHDIGKIGIRDSILLKNGKLTELEFAQIKKHPVVGEKILAQVQPANTFLPLIPGVKYHHERYDGLGYPDGLRGENIPMTGRILAVADAFDAMTSDRPYRKGMPIEKALQILENGRGSQWDPYYTDIFIELVKEGEDFGIKENTLYIPPALVEKV